MSPERSLRTRKRKHVDYIEILEDEEGEEELSKELQPSLAQSEAEDLEDLTSIASEATAIDFDSRTGCPIRKPDPSSLGTSSSSDNESNSQHDDSPIDGLIKLSRDLMLRNEPELFRDLSSIHSIIKQKVCIHDMVPWAGIGGDSTRLRAFGFLGNAALARLDNTSDVRLHAPEKQGQDALLDERANRKAICILHKTRERFWKGGKNEKCIGSDDEPKIVNPTLVADKLCAAICLDSNVLCSKELVAYQTNLHNGAKHLAAHLDAPLHEGFGKVIVTVGIRGSATILLIGKGDDDEQDGDNDVEDSDEKSDRYLQPAWKFHLDEGEAYVLSGNARNMCLHAVLADCDDGDRESLNLRFGIHSVEEAEQDIKRHWPDLW